MSFAQEVIHSLGRIFYVHLIWSDSTLTGNLISWLSKDGDLLYLPIFYIWNLWHTRNNYIFDNKEPIISRLCHRIMLEVTSHQVPQVKRTKIRHIGEPPDKLFPMEFFDGAAEKSIGGAGVCICISEQHYLSIKLGCGCSTNT